jgi:hypothetical protein
MLLTEETHIEQIENDCAYALAAAGYEPWLSVAYRLILWSSQNNVSSNITLHCMIYDAYYSSNNGLKLSVRRLSTRIVYLVLGKWHLFTKQTTPLLSPGVPEEMRRWCTRHGKVVAHRKQAHTCQSHECLAWEWACFLGVWSSEFHCILALYLQQEQSQTMLLIRER